MKALAAVPLLLLSVPASADVVMSTASGFSTEYKLDIAAPPSRVWAVLVQPSRWWSKDHTYSGSSANLTLDPRAGGCWCERLKGGGGVEHMRVVFVQPGETLRLAGALGPLQQGGVAGALTFELKGVEGRTRLVAHYNVGGFVAGGFSTMAFGVDAVLREQLASLRRVAEASGQ